MKIKYLFSDRNLLVYNRTSSCCGKPYFYRNGQIRYCCGNQTINLKSQICCEGKIIKASPKRKTCCGDEAFNPRKKLCCNGRISGKGRTCCGNKHLKIRKQICCCGNVVLPGKRRKGRCCIAPNGTVSVMGLIITEVIK